MDAKEQVLAAMRDAGNPIGAGDVEKATGLGRKEIDKAFKDLKNDNSITSPVRCKWSPTQS